MTGDQQFILAMLGIFVPSTLTAATAIILLVLNKRMKQYHDTVNSKMDMLLVAEKSVAHSAGVLEGIASEKLDALSPQPVIIVQDTPVDVKVVTPPEEATLGTTDKPMQVEVVQTEGTPVPVEVVNPEEK